MRAVIKMAAALGAALLAAGCVVISVGDDGRTARDILPRGGQASCEASAYTPLIGLADQDIDRDRLPQAFRIVCHDCQATADFNADRLTIQLDAQNKVSAVTCG